MLDHFQIVYYKSLIKYKIIVFYFMYQIVNTLYMFFLLSVNVHVCMFDYKQRC